MRHANIALILGANIAVILGVLCSFLTMESRAMSKDGEKSREDSFIITPGGPKSPDKVHTVKPGERLQVNPDGTYSIVPDEHTDGKGPSSDADKIKRDFIRRRQDQVSR